MNLQNNKNFIIAILVILCLVLAGILVYPRINQNTESNQLTKEQVIESALAYINTNIFTGSTKAKLSGEIIERHGLYVFQIEANNQKLEIYITKDAKLLFPSVVDLTKIPERPSMVQNKESEDKKATTTIGHFIVTQDQLCLENNKPIIYFFGINGCSHCQWEHPVIEKVVEKFQDNIVFHNNMDSDNDSDIFSKYSSGGVPTLVLGCRYYREGSGERSGQETETKNLTALICDLTNNQPAEVCEPVKNLIGQ